MGKHQLKKKSDFENLEEYMAYTKTSEFLQQYSWKGKTKETIIQEMALPDFEQDFLDEALEVLSEQHKFSGMELDQFILQRLDESEATDDITLEEIMAMDKSE